MAKKRKRKPIGQRRWFTATELVEVWDRWQRGETAEQIGCALNRARQTIRGQLVVYGGIRPRRRCRSSRALTLSEREEITRGIASGQSMRSIAVRLGRAPSTVSREVTRNGGYDMYRASAADERAWDRALRPKRCRLNQCSRLRQPHKRVCVPLRNERFRSRTEGQIDLIFGEQVEEQTGNRIRRNARE
jgi:hypothetical protein